MKKKDYLEAIQGYKRYVNKDQPVENVLSQEDNILETQQIKSKKELKQEAKATKKATRKKKRVTAAIALVAILGVLGLFGSMGDDNESKEISQQPSTQIEQNVEQEASTNEQDKTSKAAELGNTDKNENASTENEINTEKENETIPEIKESTYTFSLKDVPAYSSKAYVSINGGVPAFTQNDLTLDAYEKYGTQDSLGRCTVCIACVGKELMPTGERGNISNIYPTGWVQNSYKGVSGGYIYNRCHLLGYQLTGENANKNNLITGTRYMNVEGMLPFENMVADYIKETNNHVMYRVTPIFEGNNLLATGVHMEALSVEDAGEGISFNVFCYNVQPGITLNYATGDNYQPDTDVAKPETQKTEESDKGTNISIPETQSGSYYVLNTKTKKFHLPTCGSLPTSNRQDYEGSRESLIQQGYDPCKKCNP